MIPWVADSLLVLAEPGLLDGLDVVGSWVHLLEERCLDLVVAMVDIVLYDCEVSIVPIHFGVSACLP